MKLLHLKVFKALLLLAAFGACGVAQAAAAAGYTPALVMLGPVQLDFILFACVLLGIALFHHHTFNIAVGGLVLITLYKLLVTGFKPGPGFDGLLAHLGHEWVVLANLLGLLLGFALLSKQAVGVANIVVKFHHAGGGRTNSQFWLVFAARVAGFAGVD